MRCNVSAISNISAPCNCVLFIQIACKALLDQIFSAKTVHLVLKSGEGVKALLRKCGYNRENEEFYFIACKRPGEPLIQVDL